MKIGVIGGSGLYAMEGLTDVRSVSMETPFGAPSDNYVHGRLGEVEVFFLPRHGVGHRLLPSEINHRANIMGFKMLGVERIVSVSAVGSLDEAMRPRDVVLPDQYFDRTKQFASHTFFGRGLVAHVGFGDPACAELREAMARAIRAVLGAGSAPSDVRLHVGGAYVNMEGPAFSTRAESQSYRARGFSIIGMTSLPEAKLCREAELCYQAMAMVTDYDCWRESEGPVTVEMIIGHLTANTQLARRVLVEAIPLIARGRSCSCGSALASALITERGSVPAETLERLRPIVGRYWR